jgi:recombination protein RecA
MKNIEKIEQMDWQKARESLFVEMQKDYGKGVIGVQKARDSVSTGSIGLDASIGCGGYPIPSIVEIFGPNSGGKTMLAYTAIANAIKKFHRPCAILDLEFSFNDVWARTLGIDLSLDENGKYKWIDLVYPVNGGGEEALDIVEKLMRSGIYPVIVVDSVAALVPKEEIEGNIADTKNRYGLQAKMMSVAMRKLTGILKNSDSCVIFINQIRESMEMWGDPEVTPAGQALKFYSSVRIRVNRVGKQILDVNNQPQGHTINTKIKKNRFGAPFRETEFSLYYYRGIDKLEEMYKLGKKFELLKKSNNQIWFGEISLGSIETLRQTLHEDPVEVQLLEKAVYDKMFKIMHPRGTEFMEDHNGEQFQIKENLES